MKINTSMIKEITLESTEDKNLTVVFTPIEGESLTIVFDEHDPSRDETDWNICRRIIEYFAYTAAKGIPMTRIFRFKNIKLLDLSTIPVIDNF